MISLILASLLDRGTKTGLFCFKEIYCIAYLWPMYRNLHTIVVSKTSCCIISNKYSDIFSDVNNLFTSEWISWHVSNSPAHPVMTLDIAPTIISDKIYPHRKNFYLWLHKTSHMTAWERYLQSNFILNMPQSQSLSDLIKFMPLAKDVSFFAGSPGPIPSRQGHLWGWG